MKRKIIISSKAMDMLRSHILFIARVSKTSAKKEHEKILKKIGCLESDAEIYPFLDDEYITKNKYHKLVVDKRYMILYQIKDQMVFVDYIIDTRQDYSWLIK